MTIFGKTLSQYLSFQKYILWLIIVVGLARLGLSLANVPDSTTKWLSISIVGVIGLIYYAIRVHTRGFGSYMQLLPLLVIQGFLSQAIIIAAIAIAAFTGKDNVFSVREFSGAMYGKPWLHAAGHMVFGGIIIPLLGWGVASALMWVVKKMTAQEPAARGTGA
ncbi:MAG: hypothetical protein ACJ74J_04350 [Blastocatellia bacterium]